MNLHLKKRKKKKLKNKNEISEVNELLQKNVRQVYEGLKEESQKQMFCDEFAELGGAEAIAEYMVFLIRVGREQEPVNLCFSALLLILKNVTYDSVKFASVLVSTPFYGTMISDIKKVIPHYKDSQVSHSLHSSNSP